MYPDIEQKRRATNFTERGQKRPFLWRLAFKCKLNFHISTLFGLSELYGATVQWHMSKITKWGGESCTVLGLRLIRKLAMCHMVLVRF